MKTLIIVTLLLIQGCITINVNIDQAKSIELPEYYDEEAPTQDNIDDIGLPYNPLETF